MRSLKVIACAYGSSLGGAAAFHAEPLSLAVVALAGILHAAITSHHGLRRQTSKKDPS
jgi:hypothetical protein